MTERLPRRVKPFGERSASDQSRQSLGSTAVVVRQGRAYRALFLSDSVKHATGPLLIEIEKSAGTAIGISLSQKWIRGNRSIIVIDSVKPASIADR